MANFLQLHMQLKTKNFDLGFQNCRKFATQTREQIFCTVFDNRGRNFGASHNRHQLMTKINFFFI